MSVSPIVAVHEVDVVRIYYQIMAKVIGISLTAVETPELASDYLSNAKMLIVSENGLPFVKKVGESGYRGWKILISGDRLFLSEYRKHCVH